MTEEEYQADKARRAELTAQSLAASESTPTPTQEENDKLKLGLMHPDEKVEPDNQEMPPVVLQQAYLAGVELPAPPPDTVMGGRGAAAPPPARRPAEPERRPAEPERSHASTSGGREPPKTA